MCTVRVWTQTLLTTVRSTPYCSKERPPTHPPTHPYIHILWWGSSQSVHSSHSSPMTRARARKEAWIWALAATVAWSSSFLKTSWSSSAYLTPPSVTLSWQPLLLPFLPHFCHFSRSLSSPFSIYPDSHSRRRLRGWPPPPPPVWRCNPRGSYLECSLLLARSWSTPLAADWAIEPLLICLPPSLLLPAVWPLHSVISSRGSCPFLPSWAVPLLCHSLPTFRLVLCRCLFISLPSLLIHHSNGSCWGSEVSCK